MVIATTEGLTLATTSAIDGNDGWFWATAGNGGGVHVGLIGVGGMVDVGVGAGDGLGDGAGEISM